MKKYLISPGKKQYKANLHCHSTLSDGKCTPEELVKMYKEQGYSILAITDHERPHTHHRMSTPDFMLITGYEAYIRTNTECKYDAYDKELHLNLFAKDPEDTTIICYNENYCKYNRRDNAMGEITKRAGSEETRSYTHEYINKFIRTANENGYLVAYNHPYWSMEDMEDIRAFEGCFSMEMCNFSSYISNGLEYNGQLYDKLLSAGKRIYVHGADDNHNEFPADHPKNDSFGAFAMIMPEEFTYDGVIRAMEKGDMYASMGPQFHEVSVKNGKLHVECTGVSNIYVFNGGKSPEFARAEQGKVLTGGDFAIDHRARYIRVTIEDAQGRKADTRGYTREELGLD